MLQQNTIAKLKTIVLSVSILFSGSLFAQSEKTTEKSTIVMTKSELNSFLSTIAEARRAQLNERENKRRKQDLAELRLKYQNRSQQERSMFEPRGYDDISNQQIIGELRYLNQRIDNLNPRNNALPSMNRDNATIIMPSNANPNALNPYSSGSTSTIIPSNNPKINALQHQIDSIRNADSKSDFGKEEAFADSLSTMKQKLDDVKKQMESMDAKMLASDKPADNKVSSSDKSYFKQQVYFDNNSETLPADYIPYIQDLTQILIKFPEAKVMLEGWASPLGKASYNKQLSMRRAEAVEKAFINNRIDPSRILTSFRGEDATSSEQHARRVDMSIIVK